MNPSRPIALLVCGRTVAPLRPVRGDFPDWFRAGLGEPDAPALDVTGSADLPSPRELAGAVLTGSPAMLTDREPWMQRLVAWTTAAVEDGLPLLCVCFGHQVLAESTGGEVGFHPRGREIGTVEIELEPAARDDELFGGLPERFAVQESHSQAVLRLPPGGIHLARGAHDPHQAFRVGERAWGVQFHPEFDADIVRGYLANRRADLEREGLDPERLASEAHDDPAGPSLLARFRAISRSGPR